MVGSSNARIGSVEIVSWGGGTYKQISKMLDAHYKGTIDISDYWEVGDTREEKITDISSAFGFTESMNYYGGSEPLFGGHSSQTIQMVIIGFKHETLFRNINEVNTAAVTIQLLNPLSEKSSCELGTSDTWKVSPLRTWCNYAFFDSLPKEIKDIIKVVYKTTNAYSQTANYSKQYNTTDKVFLLTQYEMFGSKQMSTNSIDLDSDGAQYAYYETDGNRIKYVNGTSVEYGLRDSFVDSDGDGCFCYINTQGVPVAFGIGFYLAPAFCL